MPFWKKSQGPSVRGGLPESALHGAGHEQFLREALAELIAGKNCDRVGVWLEVAERVDGEAAQSFSGVVWDRESTNVPREWHTLAPQRILPSSRLVSGAVIEMEPQKSSNEPIVGVMTGLRSVAWVPVEHAGRLRGILMAGAVPAQNALPSDQMIAVARKLTMALAFESERKLSNARYSDLALCNRVLGGIGSNSGLEDLLQEILDSCLPQAGRPEALPGIFACLLRAEGKTTPPEECELRLVATAAGENSASLPGAALQVLARRALREQRSMGETLHSGLGEKAGLRLIAVPVNRTKSDSDVLTVGIRGEAATLFLLERVELRARLAGAVLEAIRNRAGQTNWKKEASELLNASENAAVLLESSGAIAAANRAARMLLQLPIVQDSGHSSATAGTLNELGNFANFFLSADQAAVETWLRGGAATENPQPAEPVGFELACGARVRLVAHLLGGRQRVVALIPASRHVFEREAHATTELLHLAEWLDQGLVIYDGEENIRLMNLRFAQLAGLAPEDTTKVASLEQLVERLKIQTADPASFAYRWKELARRQEGGEREEVHLLRPAARVLERASRPVLDQDSKKIGRIELYKDLTAQRVFHAKLLQTEKMAALGQMASGAAHELSNPLTSILGYAQRLLVRGEATEHFEELRKIFAEAERAGAILRRMLMAARETGPERRAVNMNQLVQRTIDLQRWSLAAERIRVELSLDALLPNVTGDAGQLQQVLINLLGNARQAIESQANGGTIRIRTEQRGDGKVVLEVSDSGPGIPESVLSRIFDPFFTTKPAGVGTGLGLSIVLSLVREHGGQVHAASPRGGGAVFIVELPAAQREAVEATTNRRPPAAEAGGNSTRTLRTEDKAPGRVLVVEDEPTVSQLIADVLRDEGFDVETLLDGRDAKDRVVRGGYDLIVCDMKMPNFDGQTLYEGLNLELEPVRKRFLFVTGDVMAVKTRGFLERNRVPYLAKPFRVEELLEKIYQVLQPARGAVVERVSPLRKNSATTG